MKTLEGIRVLDLTQAHAGPICTLFLGAMGAEVIKIEPTWGDMTRVFPPIVKGVSPYFAFLDRNKKGITLNLKDEKGLNIFKDLVKKSDVVVENFSPGTMKDLGLDWVTLKDLNPRIVLASISGFGQTGPWSNRRSFDAIAQAASGYMWLMTDSINPEGVPLRAPEAIADTIPGLSALIGILAALLYRSKTGKGQRIDVAQMDTMIAVSQSFAFWTIAKTTFDRASRSRGVGGHGLYKAKDGYVMISHIYGRITDWLKNLTGLEELTLEDVGAWVAEKTVGEVVSLLAKAGVPVAPVQNLDDVLTNEQVIAREIFVKVTHPTLGEITIPGFPIKFSDTKVDIRTPSPSLGQHNEEVLTQVLGYSKEQVDELKSKGVI